MSKIQIEKVFEMNFRIHGLHYIGYGSLIEVLTDNKSKFYEVINREVINYFMKKMQDYNTSIFSCLQVTFRVNKFK